MSDSQSADSSRLSLNNRADGVLAAINSSTVELVNEDRTQLREEAIRDSLEGVKAVD